MDFTGYSPELIRAFHILNKAPEHVRRKVLEEFLLRVMAMAKTPIP
ncbi:MAG: hypothetical protein GTO63_20830 [Anaerolineae bacterium]|nr:hypothetical protein [Anaerolineae bacterium]NIN97225.1 hypothetical protein [Anaerolineae bacterium]NIQ80177.1 hypothetical protein [Anaerolineae bacterium]